MAAGTRVLAKQVDVDGVPLSEVLATETTAVEIFDMMGRGDYYGLTTAGVAARFAASGREMWFADGYHRRGLEEHDEPGELTGWSFARASAGTALTAAGTMSSFASGVARITTKGLLVEEQRTNLHLRSSEFDNASWSKVGGSVTANATAAPDGTTTADLFNEDAATSAHGLDQTMTVVSGTSYTISRDLKYAGRRWALLDVFGTGSPGSDVGWFDIQNGVKGAAQANVTTTIAALANGFYRCTLTFTANASGTLTVATRGASADNVTANYAGLNGAAFYVANAQGEAGASATSHIPTTSASATRAADAAAQTLSVIPEGVFFQGRLDTRSATSRPFTLHDGTDNERAFIQISSAGVVTASITVGGVTTVVGTSGSGAVVAGTTFKALLRRSLAGTWRLFLNGAAVGSESAVIALPAITTLALGRSRAGAEYMNGYVEKVALFPNPPSDAAAVTMTTL